MTNIKFTISARGKRKETPVLDFLAENFRDVSCDSIDSLFGFLEKSTLYGGRIFEGSELSDNDVSNLYSSNIGVRLPLSNQYVDHNDYNMSAHLLEKYHRPGNAVIITNDDLARWVREDFPDYRIEASVIKNINTYNKIYNAYELYDTVVLPMNLNVQLGFLSKIEHKNRITLFANAGCALTCPSKTCYASISKINKYKGGEFLCSQHLKERELLGMIDFDLDEFIELGFKRFKLLRPRPGGMTGQ